MTFFQKLPTDTRLKRDNFRLPDFTRILFASGKVRQHWESKVSKASNAWLDIERQLLLDGIRPSILIYVQKQKMAETTDWIKKNGFHFVIVATSSQSGTYRSFGSVPAAAGDDDAMYRLAVVRDMADIPRWQNAYATGDDIEIGRLLGYPECCSQFFNDHWNGLHYRDLTIPAVMNTDGEGHWMSNILGRWAGIRLTSHMPCSFHCQPSIDQAADALQCGKDANIDGVDLLEQLLRMPYKYTCLHGIAEITTPIFKISASSEATPKRFEFKFDGIVPEMAASGKDFPFQNKQRNKITESKSFKKSIEAIASQKAQPQTDAESPLIAEKPSPIKQDEKDRIGVGGEKDSAAQSKYESGNHPDQYKMNGFSSFQVMDESHAPIVDAADSLVVADLGCGNGVLLDKIQRRHGSRIIGCDTNKKAIEYASSRFDGLFLCKDIFDFRMGHTNRDNFTVILMAGRISEVSAGKRQELIQMIADHSKFLILYAYGDWMEKFESLTQEIDDRFATAERMLVQLYEDSNDYVKLIKFQIM